ncbi:MAG: metallophosphoesterase family protein [Eubacteriales bacterium]
MKSSRIILASDLHYSADTPPTDKYGLVYDYNEPADKRMDIFTDLLIEEHRQTPIDALLLLGDVSHEKPENLEAIILKHLKKLPFPVYFLPGNHENYPNDDYMRITGNPRQYTVAVDNFLFIMVDVYSNASRPHKYQNADIEFIKTACDSADGKTVILCGHYFHSQDTELIEFLKQRNDIAAVAFGHTHKANFVPLGYTGKPQIDTGNFSFGLNMIDTSKWINIWGWSITELTNRGSALAVRKIYPDAIYDFPSLPENNKAAGLISRVIESNYHRTPYNTFYPSPARCEEDLTATGEGSEEHPYVSKDGTAGIAKELQALTARGGSVRLSNARYDISAPIVIDTPCVRLSGEIWGYPSDPNGVFEAHHGTKLRLQGKDFPAILLGRSQTIGGNIISDIGIYGDCIGMDTRPLYVPELPISSSGLAFTNVRSDQCHFSKLSFCGLACGIYAAESAKIDACRFEGINTDGCYMGVMFAPSAAYYARFDKLIVADTPAFGFLLDGTNGIIHNVEIQDCHFVRNGGSFREDCTPEKTAAVMFRNVNNSLIRNSLLDYAGVFWYYEPTAKENTEKHITKAPCTSLWICGNKNRVIDNTVSHSSGDSIIIEGDENILMGNIVDGNVVISGNGNVVQNLVFTSQSARLVLTENSSDTLIFSVPEERIIRL